MSEQGDKERFVPRSEFERVVAAIASLTTELRWQRWLLAGLLAAYVYPKIDGPPEPVATFISFFS